MSTHPVVENPTSETHWTCPQAPSPEMTHHMMPPHNRCRYCKRTASDLRAEQAEPERQPNSRKTKQAVRALAAEMGVKYTTALRAYEAGRRAEK